MFRAPISTRIDARHERAARAQAERLAREPYVAKSMAEQWISASLAFHRLIADVLRSVKL